MAHTHQRRWRRLTLVGSQESLCYSGFKLIHRGAPCRPNQISQPLFSACSSTYASTYCCSKQYIVLSSQLAIARLRELERTAEHILRSERNERPSIILLSSAHVIISSEIMPEQQQQAESRAKRNNWDAGPVLSAPNRALARLFTWWNDEWWMHCHRWT